MGSWIDASHGDRTATNRKNETPSKPRYGLAVTVGNFNKTIAAHGRRNWKMVRLENASSRRILRQRAALVAITVVWITVSLGG
jgi:hypothetical protein